MGYHPFKIPKSPTDAARQMPGVWRLLIRLRHSRRDSGAWRTGWPSLVESCAGTEVSRQALTCLCLSKERITNGKDERQRMLTESVRLRLAFWLYSWLSQNCLACHPRTFRELA